MGWYRSKVLAWWQFNRCDLDVEVAFDSKFFFPVLLPLFPGVLFDHNHLDKLVTALSDQPHAIFLRRRPTSLKTRSNRDVVFGAMTSVFSHNSMLVIWFPVPKRANSNPYERIKLIGRFTSIFATNKIRYLTPECELIGRNDGCPASPALYFPA